VQANGRHGTVEDVVLDAATGARRASSSASGVAERE
jgi:hypothetical protein